MDPEKVEKLLNPHSKLCSTRHDHESIMARDHFWHFFRMTPKTSGTAVVWK